MSKVVLLCIYAGVLIIASIIVYFVLRWRKGRPLIHHFTASTIWKAFVLNSVAASLVILIALTTQKEFDRYNQKDDKDGKTSAGTSVMGLIVTLLATFVASMVAYTTMYVLFGFGGGMIAVG